MVNQKYVLEDPFLPLCIMAFLIIFSTKISVEETKSIYYDAFVPLRASSGNSTVWTMLQIEQDIFPIKILFTQMKTTCSIVQYNYFILYK